MKFYLKQLIFCQSRQYRPIILSHQLEMRYNHQQPQLQLLKYQNQILSFAFNPNLISQQSLNPDAIRHAKSILKNMVSVGSYSPCLGFQFIRQSVRQQIGRVNNMAVPIVENIFLSNGVASALQLVLKNLICNHNDAVMIPCPSYPLLAQSIHIKGGLPIYYGLGPHQNEQINTQLLQQVYDYQRKKGRVVKAIVVVNPGNPSGVALSQKSIANALQFAVKNGILVIAEQEEYQNGVFIQLNNYNSCLRVLSKLQSQIRQECEIVSINSLSKALGYQGCYIYFHNLDCQVMRQVAKIQAMGGLSSSLSQLIVQVKVNPLQQASEQTQAIIKAEEQELIRVKKAKAIILNEAFSQMKNITCYYKQGQKYAYPSIHFGERAKKESEVEGININELYCNEAYKSTGTALIAGHYFGQPDTEHKFRMSPLILPEKQLQRSLLLLKQFNNEFHERYQK